MTAFTLVLDTQAPANPTISVNDGAAITGARDVVVVIETPSADVHEMVLWGDVDPAYDAAVQPLEGDSVWQPYESPISVRLSTGDARKFVYARLRDDVGNETVLLTEYIDLDTDAPVIAIVSPISRSRISKVTGYDEATFSWESNRPFTEYQVRAVPGSGSPVQAGTSIPTAGGSLNVVGIGAHPAAQAIVTTIRGADLEAASPGDTTKWIKVFVKDSVTGLWSP